MGQSAVLMGRLLVMATALVVGLQSREGRHVGEGEGTAERRDRDVQRSRVGKFELTVKGGDNMKRVIMDHQRLGGWKEVMFGVIAGLSVVVSPAVGQVTDPNGDSAVRTDNRGPGSLNSGPGSVNSGRGSDNRGSGSANSGSGRGDTSGRRGGDDIRMAQAGDVRQEDRHADRREDRRSNAGGEVRGLDRADQVAGEHGQQGRDNARVAQTERPNRPERVERAQRPERPERPQRPERPGRN